jgi:hypothetical protein
VDVGSNRAITAVMIGNYYKELECIIA